MNLKKAILLVNVFITVLIIWMLSSIVYTWLSNLGGKTYIIETISNIEQPQTTAAVLTKDLKSFELIVNKDIFNTLEDTSGVAAVNRDGANAQETNLNLKLRGTAVGKNSTSYAVIFDGSTGKEDLYELNATIQGARIQEIHADRVILNINGITEALMLPVESAGGPGRIYQPPPRNSPPPRPPKRVSKPKKTVRPPVRPDPNNPES